MLVRTIAAARRRPAATSYDLTGPSLPSGVTISSAAGTYFDVSGNMQTAAANAPRFGYDPISGAQLGLLLEPASQQATRNNTWANAVAASDTATFQTSGTTAGTWGTLPSAMLMTFPSGTSVTWGWQVAGLGTSKGMSYIDMRLTCVNGSASTTFWRLGFTSTSSGFTPAAAGEVWTESLFAALVAGSLPTGAGARVTLRGLNGTAAQNTFDVPFSITSSLALYSTTQTLTGTITGVLPMFSVSILAGQTLDATFRLAMVDCQKQPFALSPISSNNSSYPTRSADTLKIAVADGTWNVRLGSPWAYYDLPGLVASGGTGLSITLPSAAFSAGVTGFTKAVLTQGAFPFDDKRLEWSPPALGSYVQRITVPANATYLPTPSETSPKDGHTYGSTSYYEPDVDVIVTLPANAPLNGNLKIAGGRTVRVIGGAIRPSIDMGGLHYLLAFAGPSVAAFLEGVWIDGSQTVTQADGIDIYGGSPSGISYRPDLYVQNCRVEGIRGANPATHGDVLQIQGPMGNLRVDRLSGRTGYQGLFVPPQFATTSMDFRRVDMDYQLVGGEDPVTYLLWFLDNATETPTPTRLSDFYAKPRAGQNVPAHAVWPTNGAAGGLANDGGAQGIITWPGIAACTGGVFAGVPPGGDFVPRSACGIGYKSPGYRT